MRTTIRLKHIVVSIIITVIALSCSRKTRELTPEELLRKEAGVRRSVKLTNERVNQAQFFDQNGLKIEEHWYNPNGVIVTSRELKYDEKTLNLLKINWYKGRDINKSKHVFEYDNAGKLVSEETLTPFDDRRTIKYLYYENGIMVNKRMEGSKGSLRFVRHYSYDNGNIVEFREKNDDGELVNRQTYSFDDANNKIKEVWYYDKDHPVATKEHSYSAGRLAKTARYDENDELEYTIKYEYNLDGLLHFKRWTDSEGNILTENRYTYDYH